MLGLADAQQPIDLVTLNEELRRLGKLDAAGGTAYVSGLADGLARVTNVEHYARIVREKAALRTLICTADTIQKAAL
jgi:replicative DNA helicase